jgi:hypothetical protein
MPFEIMVGFGLLARFFEIRLVLAGYRAEFYVLVKSLDLPIGNFLGEGFDAFR